MSFHLIIFFLFASLFSAEKVTKLFHDNGMLKYVKYTDDKDTTLLTKTIEVDINGFITEFIQYSKNGRVENKRIRSYVQSDNFTSIYDSSIVFHYSKNKIIEKCIFKIKFSDNINIKDISIYSKGNKNSLNYSVNFLRRISGHHPSFNSLINLDKSLNKDINFSFSIDYIKYSNQYSFPKSSYLNFGTLKIGNLPKDKKGKLKFVSFHNDLEKMSTNNIYKVFDEYKGNLIQEGGFRTNIGSFDFSSSNKLGLWIYFRKNGIKEKEEFYIYKKDWQISSISKSKNKSSKIKWAFFYDRKGILEERNNYGYDSNGELDSKTSYHGDSNNLSHSLSRKSGGDTTFYKNGNYKKIVNSLNNEKHIFNYYENGQLNSQQFWKNYLKDSLYISYYKNGQIRSHYTYLNDKLEGTWLKYYADGNLEVKRNYRNGKKHGYEIEFYDSSQPKGERNYKNGLKHGYEMEYYENGQIRSESLYQYGELDGFKKEYYKEGQLKTKFSYKNSKPFGKWIHLSKRGDSLFYANYNEMGINGLYKEFYTNGSPKYIKNYINGIQNGNYFYYGSNGKLKRKGKIENDLEEGPWFRYYANGVIERKVIMKGGKPVLGSDRYFFPNGNISSLDSIITENTILKIKYYENGNIQSLENYEIISNPKLDCWDGDCIETGHIELVKIKNGESKYYYENGNLKEMENYKVFLDSNSFNTSQSKISGKKVWFFENSDTAGICHYNRGELEGKFIKFHPNGSVKEIKNYSSNKINGSHSKYGEFGHLTELINYKNGKKNGPFVFNRRIKSVTIKSGGISNNILGTLDVNPDSVSYLYPEPNQENWFNCQFKKGSYLNDKLNGNYISIERGYKEEGLYKNGSQEGKWLTSNQDGIITKINFYKNGQRYGRQTLFYDNGNILQEVDYLEGYNNKDGNYIEYYNNGNIKLEGQYFRGEKTGIWIDYYQEGLVQRKSFYNPYFHMPDSVILYKKNGKIKDKGYLVTKILGKGKSRSTFIEYDSKK